MKLNLNKKLIPVIFCRIAVINPELSSKPPEISLRVAINQLINIYILLTQRRKSPE